MTECNRTDVRDMLPDLLHERLGMDERALADRHVATCAACAAELALLARARDAVVRRAPAIDVAQLAEVVIGETRRATPLERATSVRSARFSWRWASAAAAVLVLSIGLALIPGREHEAAARPLPLDAHLAIASDAELEAVLQRLDSLDATFAPDPEGVLTGPLTGETR